MGVDLVYVQQSSEQSYPSRYSQATLQNVLQLAGCKARVAVKVLKSCCCASCSWTQLLQMLQPPDLNATGQQGSLQRIQLQLHHKG